MFTLEDLQSVRNLTGVYFLYNKNKELVYVGKSVDIYTRILEHKFENKKDFSYFKATGTVKHTFAELLELALIDRYKNKYNLLNKAFTNMSFDKFYFHLPTEIKNNTSLESIYSAIRDLSHYIESDCDFNSRYKPNESEDKMLKGALEFLQGL